MTRKEILKLIFVNPFEKVAGWQAFGIGLVFVILTAFVGSCSGAYFDGALDVHSTGKAYSFWVAILMLFIDLVSIIVMFLLAGLVFSRKFRVADVCGTMFLAKAPTLFIALVMFLPMPELESMSKEGIESFIESLSVLPMMLSLIAIVLATIAIIVWTFALFYNAYRVSLNIKKNGVIIFIAAILIAEILSIILLKVFLNVSQFSL